MSESRETSMKSACEAIARDDRGVDAPLGQHAHGRPRVAVVGVHVRMALVIHVVQEPDDAPDLLVGAVPAGVGAHRGLDRLAMAAQWFGLHPVAQQGPGVVPRKP